MPLLGVIDEAIFHVAFQVARRGWRVDLIVWDAVTPKSASLLLDFRVVFPTLRIRIYRLRTP